MRGSRSDTAAAEAPAIDTVVDQLGELFDLRACWYEPFPFDSQLPRIEPGRIVLPASEPGIRWWRCGAGIELPVRAGNLLLGRFVLVPEARTSGVALSPAGREQAIGLADQLGPLVAGARRADATHDRR